MGFTIIWVADLNSERKNYPMKEFRVIFPISSILVKRSVYAKQSHFSIYAVFQDVWDFHKFGLQIWIQNTKITLWKNLKQFFQFHRFRSSGPRLWNKVISQYWLYFKMYGIYINLGCRFEFRRQKLPYETNLGNFSNFIDFGHQVRVYKTRSFLSISCISQCMRFTFFFFFLQIWIQIANFILWKNFGQFFQFH